MKCFFILTAALCSTALPFAQEVPKTAPEPGFIAKELAGQRRQRTAMAGCY